MKMPGIDQAVVARRAAIAERLRRIVGREWVIDSDAERRPCECDGLTAYSASTLLVVLGEKEPQWLRAGDEVSVGIEGLGRLTNRLVAR